MSDNGLALAAQRCKRAFGELFEAERVRDEARRVYLAADNRLTAAQERVEEAQKILSDVAQGKISLEDAGNGEVRLTMLPLDFHVATTLDHSYKDCADLATCEPHGSQWVAGGEN